VNPHQEKVPENVPRISKKIWPDLGTVLYSQYGVANSCRYFYEKYANYQNFTQKRGRPYRQGFVKNSSIKISE